MQPGVALPPWYFYYLVSLVPTWHVCGWRDEPLPGTDQPFLVGVSNIVRRDADDAEDRFWEVVEEQCADSGIEFNRSEWTLGHRVIHNGS